jgi:hypothetical protein
MLHPARCNRTALVCTRSFVPASSGTRRLGCQTAAIRGDRPVLQAPLACSSTTPEAVQTIAHQRSFIASRTASVLTQCGPRPIRSSCITYASRRVGPMFDLDSPERAVDSIDSATPPALSATSRCQSAPIDDPGAARDQLFAVTFAWVAATQERPQRSGQPERNSAGSAAPRHRSLTDTGDVTPSLLATN